ncbi:MAG: flippase-like domain-containing protein [Bacteroidales bacterium]|nr:flippase-like domain-containing protein [Bacteroidales bacterium]
MKENPLGIFRFNKVIIPILIGLGVGFYMIAREYSRNASLFSDLANMFSSYTFVCLFLAVMFECGREITYMIRIRMLSDNRLSWKQAFHIIMLWEFSSTVTPTSVGGSAVALFILPLEGLGAGRSTAMVMIATLLDELFYILITPVMVLICGIEASFATKFKFSLFGLKVSEIHVFIIGYSFMLLLTLFILTAIFFYPHKFKSLLYGLGNRKLFKRWQHKFNKMGDDVLTSAQEFRHKSFLYWIKVYGVTVASWSCRFLVLNCILAAFCGTATNHAVIYVRQLVMWIVLCISPTPGSSGVAEFAFPLFLNGFLKEGFEGILALLWRLFTYYPYIIAGLIVLPVFTKRVAERKKKDKLTHNTSKKKI